VAILLIESFDWCNGNSDPEGSGKWSSRNGGNLDTSTKRTGVSSYSFSSDHYLTKTVSNLGTAVIGAAIRFNRNFSAPYSGSAAIFDFLDSATAQITVGLNSSGQLYVARGAYNGTVLGTGTNVLNNSGFYYIEAKVIFDTTGSNGTVTVQLNGASEISVTGADTTSTANSYCTSIRVSLLNGNSNHQGFWVDDIYIDDSTLQGDIKVDCIKPNGAGNYTQFTPSAGSNYQNVDDGRAHDSDSTYNADSTNGHIDSYAMENSPTAGTVIAISQVAYLRKDDAGARNAAIFLRSNTTDSVGSDIVLSNSYAACIRGPILLNPDGNVAWTNAAIDALEAGVKVTS
jgi:hypothetical protein